MRVQRLLKTEVLQNTNLRFFDIFNLDFFRFFYKYKINIIFWVKKNEAFERFLVYYYKLFYVQIWTKLEI